MRRRSDTSEGTARNACIAGELNSPSDSVDGIRVELGGRNISEQNTTFEPYELRTEVIRVEESVYYRFYSDNRQLTADSIQNSEIAFTSLKSRREGAVLAEDLDIDVK